MRSLVAAAAVLWLGGGLSCTHWSPVPEPVPDPPEATTSPPQIPTPAARVASRFARFQTGLAPFEIREVSQVIVEESQRNEPRTHSRSGDNGRWQRVPNCGQGALATVPQVR